MLAWFVSLFLSLGVSVATLWAAKTLLTPSRVRNYKKATEIRRLLHPPNIPLGDLLLARATPNQRLVHAFSLTNTFVSGDIKVHKTFTTLAKALIAGAGDKDSAWRAIALSAEETAHVFLSAQQQDVAFAMVIQCITFAVVLSALFHVDLDMLHYDDVVLATNIINQRWQDSKIKDAAAMRQDDSLRSLTAHLDRWITDRDRYPNPLNVILPAYETMWRVVAVTVAHVYRYRNNTFRDAVVAFGRDPTEERFLAFGNGGQQPSMQAIILEVLRLHPPTRHIVRTSVQPGLKSWWRSAVAPGPGIDIADIEGVHLSEDYGKDTSVFDPMRFHPSRMRERPELFSFGHGRLKCVAAAWAPMAAAAIAATIVLQMEESHVTVTTGPNIGGRGGWEGWRVVYTEAR